MNVYLLNDPNKYHVINLWDSELLNINSTTCQICKNSKSKGEYEVEVGVGDEILLWSHIEYWSNASR